MTSQQSRESAVAIAEVKTDVKHLRDDISELKDDIRWMRRTMVGVIVSMLVSAAAVLFSSGGL